MRKFWKSSIGIGFTTLASMSMAFHNNTDVLTSTPEPRNNNTDILCSYDGIAATAISNPEPEKYMEYVADVYDSDLNPGDIPQHSTIPEDFSDAALREQAQRYYDQGYLLTNIRTELQYWGYGLGYGDYVFTEGFDVYDNLNAEPAFNINVVKATLAEFNAFISERMETLSFIEKLEGDRSVSYRLSYGEDIFEITYYIDSEILVQEHYFF